MGIEETAAHYEHGDIVLLHENMLKTTADEVKEINKKIYGIPQRMESLEKCVTELCKNLSDFLQKIEDKYITKEMAELQDQQILARIAAVERECAMKIEGLQKEKDKLEKRFNWLVRVIIGVGISILGYASSTAINLVISILRNGAGS